MAENINKYNVPTDENLTPSPSRMKLSAMSLPSLKISNGEIYEEARRELRYPQCIPIYQQMVLEPTIASALSLLEILISRSEWTVKTPEDAPQEEKDRAAFINWSLENMDRPWEEYIIEFLGYLQWGYQPVEKVYYKVTSGKYRGRLAPKDFRSISPTTVTRWIYDLKSGELAGLRQEIGNRIVSDFTRLDGAIRHDIPRSKFMLFRYSSKLDNPEGSSPLKSCYLSFKQKSTIEDYQIIGVSRDMGGVPVLGVDIDFLAKASEEGSDEAKALAEMDRQAALLHAGEQSFVRMPIAYNDQGKPLFTFDLIGINGGGKQYDPEEMIKRLENKMLMSFLADVLKLGTESQGSYALADSKTNLLAMGVENHLKIIKRTLNHDFIKQIYAINGWEYNQQTSAKFCYGDVESLPLEDVSKFIQRTVTSGALRPTKQIEDFLTKALNLDPQKEDDMDIIESEMTSAAGQSNGTSGYGNKQQNNSDSNPDNAASVPEGFRKIKLVNGKEVVVMEEDYSEWEDLKVKEK